MNQKSLVSGIGMHILGLTVAKVFLGIFEFFVLRVLEKNIVLTS
jgi:hypothetical protein